MNNLSDYLTDLWTFQDLSKKVRNISTSWHPANSGLATSHWFTNGMVEYRQMLLLESRLRHGDALDHQLIFYIHVRGSFDLHAKHPKIAGQGFELFICNTTTYYFRAKRGSFYGVLALAILDDEKTVNLNEDTRIQAPSQLVIIVICINKTCNLDRQSQRI